jgi:GT2 family glycosyltransferase
MLISADCARACGPWDESFFLYSEETDFALRAGDLGFATAFVPARR